MNLYIQNESDLPTEIKKLCDLNNIEISAGEKQVNNYFYENGQVCYLDSFGGLILDLNKQFNYFKIQRNKVSPGILLKSIGRGNSELIDATAGVCRDSMFFIANGLKVRAYERNPILYFLIKSNSFNLDHTIRDNFQICFGELTKSCESLRDKVVYYDPMFIKNKSKRLPKKNMQILSSLVGEDLDITSQIIEIIELSPKKLIVKMSDKSDSYIPEMVKYQHKSKTIRLDVY